MLPKKQNSKHNISKKNANFLNKISFDKFEDALFFLDV